MASRSGTLYIGVTSNIERRVFEHRYKLLPGFTARYNITRLVYLEEAPTITDAIAREKQLKKWRREKKTALIEAQNPNWNDLSVGWFDAE